MTELDKITVELTGRVKETFDAQTGTALTLELMRDGAKYPDRVTVWGVQTKHDVGQRVNVTGLLTWSTKTADNGKRYFNVNVNYPTVTNVVENGWPTATPNQTEAPTNQAEIEALI
jgi:hypothetical protein